MSAAGISLKFVNEKTDGRIEINRHLVFDVKMNFTCKDSYVAGGNLTNPPDNVPTYTSVISCESVRILFLIAALYDIEVHEEDIRNSLLNAQCSEKDFSKSGTKFKCLEGLWLIIMRTLYGLKIARALFRAHLVNNLKTMGFKRKFYD